MLMKMATFRDALNNLSYKLGSNSEYSRGVLVGLVSAFMAGGMSFESAIALCSANAPRIVRAGCVPDSWIGAFHIDRKQIDGRDFWVRSEGTDA